MHRGGFVALDFVNIVDVRRIHGLQIPFHIALSAYDKRTIKSANTLTLVTSKI